MHDTYICFLHWNKVFTIKYLYALEYKYFERITLKWVKIYLSTHSFCHGQLYL
jgi:hypothetical protein